MSTRKKKWDVYTRDLIEKLSYDYLNELLSFRELTDKYNLKSNNTVRTKLISNGVKLRTLSESGKIRASKHPLKHSDSAKIKMRKARLKWMKENPNKTAWRKKSMSYPEKLLKEKFEELGWDKKYIIEREKSFYPFYADFSFIEQKAVIEIDGSQHLLPHRKKKDDEKDKLIQSKGWRVFRVTVKQLYSDFETALTEIEKFVGSSKSYDSSRIIEKKTKREKYLERIRRERERNNGKTDAEVNSKFNQRRATRPPLKELLQEISDSNFVAVGKKYGVSDNAIRNWIDKKNPLYLKWKKERESNKKIYKPRKPKSILDQERKKNGGRTDAQKLFSYNQRKVMNRPSKEVLQKEIDLMGITEVARRNNVCRATIYRWIK